MVRFKPRLGTARQGVGHIQPGRPARDGDPATLTDRQLAQLMNYLEKIAFGGDQAKIQAVRRRAMLDAGIKVDTDPDAKAEAIATADEW